MFFSCLHSKSPHTSNQFSPSLSLMYSWSFLSLIFMTWNVACARVAVLCLQAHFPPPLCTLGFSPWLPSSSPVSFRIVTLAITIIILTFWECCRRGGGAERWAGALRECAQFPAESNVCLLLAIAEQYIRGLDGESLLARAPRLWRRWTSSPEQEPPPSSAPPQPLQAGRHLTTP